MCDCMPALLGAQGRQAMPDSMLAQAVRAVHAGIAMAGPEVVSYFHVSGHAGFVANELADGLAKAGAEGRSWLGGVGLDWGTWVAGDAQSLAWIPHVLWTRGYPSAAPSFKNGTISWPAGPLPFRKDPLDCMKPFLSPEVIEGRASKWQCEVRLSFRVASYNVLSIHEPNGGETSVEAGLRGQVGRASLLAASLKKAGVRIAGLQETRSGAGSGRCGDFYRLCSGCDSSGNFGTELWVDTVEVLGGGQSGPVQVAAC